MISWLVLTWSSQSPKTKFTWPLPAPSPAGFKAKNWPRCSATRLFLVGTWKSTGMMNFPTEWRNKSHVPKHQPVTALRSFKRAYYCRLGGLRIHQLHSGRSQLSAPMAQELADVNGLLNTKSTSAPVMLLPFVPRFGGGPTHCHTQELGQVWSNVFKWTSIPKNQVNYFKKPNDYVFSSCPSLSQSLSMSYTLRPPRQSTNNLVEVWVYEGGYGYIVFKALQPNWYINPSYNML